MSSSTHSTAFSRASSRKRPRRMRVKKYNVDVSNSVSSIDMSGRIEQGSEGSVDRATLNNIGMIHLNSPGVPPSPLTRASLSNHRNLRGNAILNNILPENPYSDGGDSKSSSSSSSSSRSPPNQLDSSGEDRIKREDPNSTHARRSLSSKSSSDSSSSSQSSSSSSSSDFSVSDSDDSRKKYAIPEHEPYLEPVVPPRKSAPSAPSSPSSAASSVSSTDKYNFPSDVYREKIPADSPQSETSGLLKDTHSETSSSPNPKRDSLEQTNPTDESTDAGHANSYDNSPASNGKPERNDVFYGKYPTMYNQQQQQSPETIAEDHLPLMKDFESHASSMDKIFVDEESENDNEFTQARRNLKTRSVSPEYKVADKNNHIEQRESPRPKNHDLHTKPQEVARKIFPEASSATENTSEIPRVDGDDSINAQPEQLTENLSIEEQRSLDRERRFQVWLEHGIYVPPAGSEDPESHSESTPTSTESQEETKELDGSKKWWQRMFSRKEDKSVSSKASSKRQNSDPDLLRNDGYNALNDTDVNRLSGEVDEAGQDDREELLEGLKETGETSLPPAGGNSESQPTHTSEDDYMNFDETEKDMGTTGGSFVDQIAARSRERMNKNADLQSADDYDKPYQRQDESSVSASRGSLADQIAAAAAARSKKKTAPEIRKSEDYDEPYQRQDESSVSASRGSLADQIAAAAAARSKKETAPEIRKSEDYDEPYQRQDESSVSASRGSLADLIAAAAKARKSKQQSTPTTKDEYDESYKSKKEMGSSGPSLADQIAASSAKLKSQSGPKTEEDYDRLYDIKSTDSGDISLAEQVAAAANAVKLKSQSAPKTEEDYDRLYDNKSTQSGDTSLAEQVAAAANAVKLKNKSALKTEEDYDKLYDPKKEMEKSDALANKIAAAAMARRQNKSEDDFEGFYQKPQQQESKEPQRMFNLKPVEHRRTRAERYFRELAASSGSDDLEDPESNKSSSHRSNSDKENLDSFEDDAEKSVSSTPKSSRGSKGNSDKFDDIEASISSAEKSSTELKESSSLTKSSPSSTPSPSHVPVDTKRKQCCQLRKCCFRRRKCCCCRPIICYTYIIIIVVVVAATVGSLYHYVFSENTNDNDSGATEAPNNPFLEISQAPTRFPSLPVLPKPATSMPSMRPVTKPPTNPPTKPPTNPPTSRPTFDPTGQQSFPSFPTTPPASQQTLRPTVIPTADQIIPTLRPTTLTPTMQPTKQPVLTTAKPTLPKVSELRQMLVSQWPPLQISLNVPASPQRKAFDWLVAAGATGYSDQQLIQRFVLATFFFSTNGNNWSNNEGWLSAENECQWFQTKSFRDHCDSYGNLIRLELNGNSLAGSLPSELALLSNSLNGLDLARAYDIGGDFLTGPLPSEIGLLTKLQYISLSNQQITGTLPNEIGQLSLLNVLDLTRNMFEGSLTANIANLKRLYNLYLGFNYLTGAIPSSIGEMQFLVNLDLEENLLSSSLPSELAKLNFLQSLALGGNKLTGTIPSFLGQLSNLGGSFELNDNLLIGRIPTELGQLTMLRTVLNLSSNQLSGPIPTELDRLVKLGNLHLQKNLLTGSIPSSFSKLSGLQVLQLEYNNLNGDVAASVCDSLVTDKIDNGIVPTSLLTDCLVEVDCECCQYCCSEIGGCECQFANTDKDFLCRHGDVLSPTARMAMIFD